MYSVTFLGTGGGRFVLLTQRRHTGGLWLDLGPKIVVDPGPGSLIRALEYKKKPAQLNAVLVSHKHLDHYNDAELMVEAMTGGVKKERGLLAISRGALEYVSEYHRNAVKVITPEPGEEFEVGGVRIQAIQTHDHEDGIGFRFKTDEGDIVYSSDTGYSEKLAENYGGAKILILNVIFPSTKDLPTHLNTEKALRIVDAAKPELAVIQHFGMTMLNAGPEGEAKKIEEATGVKTIAARDGMTLGLEREKQSRLAGF